MPELVKQLRSTTEMTSFTEKKHITCIKMLYLSSSFYSLVNFLQEVSFSATFGVSDSCGVGGFSY